MSIFEALLKFLLNVGNLRSFKHAGLIYTPKFTFKSHKYVL